MWAASAPQGCSCRLRLTCGWLRPRPLTALRAGDCRGSWRLGGERGNFLPPCLSWAAWERLPPSVSSRALLPDRPA